MTDSLKNEMTSAVDRLDDRTVPPAIRIAGASDETTVGVKLFEAYQHSRVEDLVVGPPLTRLKRLVRRLLRPALTRQSTYNRAMADAVGELNHQLMVARHELDSMRATVEQSRRSMSVHVAALGTQIDDMRHETILPLASQLADLTSRVPAAFDLVSAAERLEHHIEAQRVQLSTLALMQRELTSQYLLVQRQLDSLMDDLRRTGAAPDFRGTKPSADLSPFDERAYEAFEAAFRGPEAMITERLRPYLADVADLKGGALPVVDLGSGRGEWLRLLREAETPAIGFDTNERFAEEAHTSGLNVEVGDAVELLSARPPRSVGAVTAFHLVEHLSVRDITALIEAAFVALAPGGALILETPNVSNLSVGASSFYKDPTHVRPVHPDWLSFLVAHHGFVGVETRFLHPAAEYDEYAACSPGDATTPTEWLLGEVGSALYGPQDFAVVARKPRIASS